MPQHRKGKSGSRKHGRNKIGCARYKTQRRREKNKLRKLKKLLETHPKDKCLIQTIGLLKIKLG